MESKNLQLQGGMIEMIELLAHTDCSAEPVAGEELDRIAKILSEWMIGPNFVVDCRLSGIDPEKTKLVVVEIAACAQNEESVVF